MVCSEGEVINMSNIFQIGKVGNVKDSCGGLEPIVRIIKLGIMKIEKYLKANQKRNIG